MALAEALDAEALGQVLRRYFETVSAVLTRHGGTVEKFAGDAVMAAFGVPVSHEDDALRAARGALEIGRRRRAECAAREEHGIRLEVRIGIETGEVVATPTTHASASSPEKPSASPLGSGRRPERTRSSSANSRGG